MKENSLTIEKNKRNAPASVQKKNNNEESRDRPNGDFSVYSNQSSNFSSAFSSAATDPNQKNNSLSNSSHIQKFTIQPKLTIGQPNDKYEQEADRVADQVMRIPLLTGETSVLSKENSKTKTIQRIDTGYNEEELQKKPFNFPNSSTIQRQLDPAFDFQSTKPEGKIEMASTDEKKLAQTKPLGPQITPYAQRELEEGPIQPKLFLQNRSEQEAKTIQTKDNIQKQVNIDEKEEPGQIESHIQKQDEEEKLQGKPIIQKQEEKIEAQAKTMIQKSESNNAYASSEVTNKINNTKRQGAPLSSNTRSFMESRFEADFSNVRIHNDNSSSELNKQLNSQAFTTGNSIYFNQGKYSPETSQGKHLLAHELTHTIQQGSSNHLAPKIQKQVDDPQKVMTEIFKDAPAFFPNHIPPRYWFALKGRQWLDDFILFLGTAGFDHTSLNDEHLVYMALLYATMSKEFPEWNGGTFKMSTADSLEGKLEIYFNLPTSSSGEMGVTISFSTKEDSVLLESSTNVSSAAFHPLSAMSFAMPDTEIYSMNETFEYVFDSGAYKGNGAKFNLTYILFTPKDPFKKQTVYYIERTEFILVSKEKLDISFEGKFDIPLYETLDKTNWTKLVEYFPYLIAISENLESKLGGMHSKGEDVEYLVMGFAKEREQLHSIQQLLDPNAKIVLKAEYFVAKMITLLERFDQEEAFIDKNQPPTNFTFDSLKEAQEKAVLESSRGYVIINQDGKYILYLFTSADLIWLAKKLRKEETSNVPRYQGINPTKIVDAEFYELPYSTTSTLQQKLDMIKQAYFSTTNQLMEHIHTPYYIIYKTGSGFFGAIGLKKERATQIWQSADMYNEFSSRYIDYRTNEEINIDVVAMYIFSDTEGELMALLKIDDKHFKGRAIFAEIYKKISAAKDISDLLKLKDEFDKLSDPDVKHFVFNELLRPNSMNPDQTFKEALKSLQSPGNVLTDKLAEIAWGAVAAEAEKKGLEMMEQMLAFLDSMVVNDLLMKAMLMEVRNKKGQEKKDVAGLFTEDEDEAANLITILGNEQTMQAFLMNNTIEGFENISLDTVAEHLKESRDELQESVEERKELQKQPMIEYEKLFLVQPGEIGEMIRGHVYDAFGFKLDPKKFPHEEYVDTGLFPSPLHEGGKEYSNLLEQIYINKTVNLYRTVSTLKTIQTVAIVASVFSLARGAGLWAISRLGLAAGTLKAVVVEALVTSIAAGIMLEGIQVAMGKKFSWGDLAKSIGEAFILMLFFSWANSLFKLALVRFTVNSLLFIGYGVGRFYITNKRWPNLFEFNLIVLESILLITLLHIGTKLTDPFFRRVFKLKGQSEGLRPVKEEFEKLVKDISTEAAKKNPDRALISELGEKLIANIKLYREWLEANRSEFTEEEVKAELKKIDDLILKWQEAKILDVTKLRQVAQTDTLFYYRPGEDSAKVLKEKFGEGVEIDPETKTGTIKTLEGEYKLIPEDLAADAATAEAAGERLTDIFGNNIRMLDRGVYAVHEGFLPKIQEYIVETKKGNWIALGEDMYIGEIGGRRIVVISELLTTTIKTALAIEGQTKGGGMEYLNKSLSEPALEGLKLLRAAEMANMSDIEVLQRLKEIGDQIANKKYPKGLDGEKLEPRPKSLTQYLEKLYLESKFDAIREYRKSENLAEYSQNVASTGTVAMVETSAGKKFGSSENLSTRRLTQADVDSWFKRLVDKGLLTESDKKTFLKHAEAEALINAYNDGIRFSGDVTLYVDRPTCGYACRIYLEALLPELGIKTLRIYWINAEYNPSLVIKAKEL